MKEPILTALVLMAVGVPVWAETVQMEGKIFVAPNGNDAWSGQQPEPNPAGTDGPLATLSAARDAARKLGPGRTRHIVVRGGAYYLEEPLVLGPQDAGLILEAAPGEKPLLYGGRRITGWKPDGDRFWAAPVPEATTRKWDFRMLVVNGTFCSRARLPREGFFTHLSEFNVPWMSTTGGGWQRQPTPEELTTLRYRPEDLGPWLDVANAELTVYHVWDESVVGLDRLDEATHTLTFSNPAGHPPGAFGVSKYVVWNIREGMTAPGQWYLDRTAGKVVYWPRPGEDMAEAEVVAPTLESIIRIQGQEGNPVRDVVLKGLTLSVTHTPLEAGGFGAGRFDGAVSLQFAEGCQLRDLTLVNVGGQGIKAEKGRKLRVEGCEITDTGACGLIVWEEEAVLTRNHIQRVGRTYPSAIGLWIGGQRIEVSHNEIHDTPYTAIAGEGNGHRIEYNLIYHAMQELHDGAGLYITFCKGIQVRGNVVRDIAETGGYGASAYYLDEQAEDCLVEGNLALRVDHPSHNHMAKNNTLRHNVFIAERDALLSFPKCVGYTLEGNVVSAGGKIRLQAPPDGIVAMPHNLFFSGTGQVEWEPMDAYQGQGPQPWEPRDGSLLADPQFVIGEQGHYSYRPDSPAWKLGIPPLDVSQAGR